MALDQLQGLGAAGFSSGRPLRGPARTRQRQTGLALLVVVLAAVGLPAVVAWVTGSLSIPHNDAWSHSKIAMTFARTGDIHLLGWNRTGLLGQVVVLGPLGASVVAQQLFVAALACVGLVATFFFLQPRTGSALAVFGSAVVGALPQFGLLATSYMSDMPAFVAGMVCIAVGDRALRSDSRRALALAVLVGLWGATIREQAIVAPVVILLMAVLLWRRRHLTFLLLVAAVTATSFGLFESYRRGLPDGDPPTLHLSARQGVTTGIYLALTLSLYLAPAVFLRARPRTWSGPTRVLASVTLAGSGLLAVTKHGNVLLGNYLDAHGAYSDAFLGTRNVLPQTVVLVLSLIACASLAGLVGLGLSRQVRVGRLEALFAGAFFIGTLAQAVVGQAAFGRYLLPVVPIALAVLLAPAGESRGRPDEPGRRVVWALPLGVLAAVTVVSGALLTNALSFDAARWQAAEQLQAQGVPADRIDAGLEWVGYHARGVAHQGAVEANESRYSAMFGSHTCATVAASPLANRADPVATYPYRTFAVFGHSDLHVYRVGTCG